MIEDSFMDKDSAELPLVTDSIPIADGLGRLFTLLPGTRVELDQYDQWQVPRGESLLAGTARVSLSHKEQERQRLGAERLKERLSSIPWYAEAARDYGKGYWEMLYASAVNS
jgi:hypothetical protein